MNEKIGDSRTLRTARIAPAVMALALSLAGCSLFGPDSQTQAAIDAINAIGEVTTASEQAIDAAKDAYDNLDESQQGKVTNHETLTAAESKLAELKEQKAQADQSEANKAIAAIDAIGDVTLEKKDQVTQARSSYDALTSDQKQLVTNYQALTDAETKIEKLGQAFTVGQTVTTSDWSVTLTDARVASTLESSESTTYWEPGEGTCFLILELDVECLTSSKPTVDGDGLTNIVASYNGNTYSSWTMSYLSSRLWLYIRRTYLEANIPCHLYVYTSIPEKALDDGQPITVDLKVGGEPKTITVR